MDCRLIQLEHDLGVVLDQRKDGCARTLSPFITAVKGVFALLAMGEAVVAAYEIVRVLIVQRRTIRHNIYIPTLEQRECRFEEETMELLGRAWL